MSRHAIVNMVLAVVALAFVGTALYLETASSAPAATVASTSTTTTTTTTVPATTTTMPTTTTSTTTTTPTSTTSTTTTTTTTTTTMPTTTTTVPPPPRDFLPVVVVNGSTQGERLPPIVAWLGGLGYPAVRGLVGAVQTPKSTIYVIDESFRSAGEVLAKDMNLRRRDVRLFSKAPPIAGIGNAVMIVYLGGE